MRAWIALALCGCGRFGFDSLATGDATAAPDAPDVGFFLSPTGDDANAGTRAAPWLTFGHALHALQPGGVLNLLPGDYDGMGPSGTLAFDCMADGIADGTQVAPITVRADRARTAHLYNVTSPLRVAYCQFWVFEQLWVEGIDDATDTVGSVASIYYSNDMVLRGLLAQKPNRYNNNNAIEIGHSTRVLVEDSEVYDFFRGGFTTFESHEVTMRRDYANGRGYPDIAGGYVSTCAGGDDGFDSYYAFGGTFEDMIVEDVCDVGFAVITGMFASGDTGHGDNHHFVDDIVLGPGADGFYIASDCTSTAPCSTPDRIASDNTITNSSALQATRGFFVAGQRNALDHVSALGGAATSAIDLAVEQPADPSFQASATVIAALGDGTATGIVSTNQTSWSVDHSNMIASGAAYNPNDSHVTNSASVNPMLGGCDVYIPATSPMATAGPSGTSIGADIRTQSLNEAPTAMPFWNADGSWAACGAIVPGVNDEPTTSCIGVGARLHVGSGGCPVP